MVLCRCRCSNVVACHADDADTYASVQVAPEFLFIYFFFYLFIFFSNLAPVSFSFSSACLFCVFSFYLEYKLFPETFSRSCKLLYSEQQHQEPVVRTFDSYLRHMFHKIIRVDPVGSLRLVGTYVTSDNGRLDILTSSPE